MVLQSKAFHTYRTAILPSSQRPSLPAYPRLFEKSKQAADIDFFKFLAHECMTQLIRLPIHSYQQQPFLTAAICILQANGWAQVHMRQGDRNFQIQLCSIVWCSVRPKPKETEPKLSKFRQNFDRNRNSMASKLSHIQSTAKYIFLWAP